jgi:hypothetical protein
MDHPSGLARAVVRPRGADLACERHGGGEEADLAVLVLDVQLDRVHALVDELQVLGELPVERGERHRHVDPAHLVRVRPRLLDDRLLHRRRLRDGRGLLPRRGGVVEEGELGAGGERGDDGEEQRKGDGTAAPTPSARVLTPRAKALVRLHLLEQHRHGRANGMWKTLPAQEDRRIGWWSSPT